MQPDEARADLVRRWLTKVDHDLLLSEQAVSNPELADGATFHAQQASEKALKAFLTWHNRPFGKTHNLPLLVQACAAIAVDFSTLLDAAETLTPYAVAGRYPDDLVSPTREDAVEALDLARAIVTFVEDRLPREARP